VQHEKQPSRHVSALDSILDLIRWELLHLYRFIITKAQRWIDYNNKTFCGSLQHSISRQLWQPEL
jgi:hypothetical protein